MRNRILKVGLLALAGALIFGLPCYLNSEQKTDEKQSAWEQYRQRKSVLEKDDKDQKAFNAQAHYEFVCWCLNQRTDKAFRENAVKELIQISERAPDYQAAQVLLPQMGYYKHKDKWIPFKDYVAIKEIEVNKIIPQIASKKEEEQAAAREELKKYDAVYRIRPLIKSLDNSSEVIRLYAASELQASPAGIVPPETTAVVPYLVKSSIMDFKDSVSEASFAAVKTYDSEISVSWYGYYMAALGGDGDGFFRVRAANMLGQFGKPAVLPLLTGMYHAMIEIRATMAVLDPPPPNIKNIRTSLLINPPGGQNIIPAVDIELPEVFIVRLRTSGEIPIPVSYSMPEQLNAIGYALETATGEKFGADYDKWRGWYKNNK
ncbi:MAG: hypothetical protein V1701_02390 [Planctomycetota bacterium]